MVELLAMSSKISEELNQILDEYDKACSKHSVFITRGILEACSILNEEAGEVNKATLELLHDIGTLEELKTEIAQTAAVCIRFLEYLNKK